MMGDGRRARRARPGVARRRRLCGYGCLAARLLWVVLPARAFRPRLWQATHSWPSAHPRATRVLAAADPDAFHTVAGVRCIPVTTTLPRIGDVTILEATADAQEALVNAALEEEDDRDDGLTATTTTTTTTTTLAHADPYGAVLWPAATAVARHMLQAPETWLTHQRVLELGTGTGLVSLAAAAGGAAAVTATDWERLPLQLLEYAQAHLNPAARRIPIQTRVVNVHDFVGHNNSHNSHNSTSWARLPPATVVVAADLLYEPVTGRALAHVVVQALAQGARVLIGDSPGRAGRPAFVQELQSLGVTAVFNDVEGTTVTGERHALICGPGSTSVSPAPRPLRVALLALDPMNLPPFVSS
jgi:predicted nicotinamide N-methyase